MNHLQFDSEFIGKRLHSLDSLQFGVIGFDSACIVRRYNSFESVASGLAPERVIGKHLFLRVAQCMNNFMIAQRFEDALNECILLDDVIDYILTLRMQPTKVKLRLLSSLGMEMRFILVKRQPESLISWP